MGSIFTVHALDGASNTAADSEKLLQQQTIFLMGDSNFDGKLDPDDATQILVYYVSSLIGKQELWTTETLEISDVDGDSVIGPKDASSVLQYYVSSLVGQPVSDWKTYVRAVPATTTTVSETISTDSSNGTSTYTTTLGTDDTNNCEVTDTTYTTTLENESTDNCIVSDFTVDQFGDGTHDFLTRTTTTYTTTVPEI